MRGDEDDPDPCCDGGESGGEVKTFSGGMKRRINLAVGLVNDPRLLFLDEPTVGVDPQSRNHIFESVERLNRERGMTVLYTTHYMEEAERLCQRVGIIDRGQIIAMDTPKMLIDRLGGGIIQIGLSAPDDELAAAVAALPDVKAVQLSTPQSEKTAESGPDNRLNSGPLRPMLKIEAAHANDALLQTLHLFNERNVEVLSIETLEPNLETVFLQLTGKSLRN